MPVLEKKAISEENTIGIWCITETLDHLKEAAALTDAEESHYRERKSENKKKQFLAARLMLNDLLGEKFAVLYLGSGQPYLDGGPYRISVSHSGEFAAVVLSQKERVGVDIEKYPRTSLLMAQDYFLNEDEIAWTAGAAQHLVLLHLIWSGKEAVIKYFGDEKLNFRQEVFIPRFELEEAGVFSARVRGECISLLYWTTDDYVFVSTN